jgi:hypothetical protein
MNEREFLIELRHRAQEQHILMRNMPFPYAFTFIAEWLGNHPWRLLIPLAFVLTLLFRGIFGTGYVDFILKLFRSL